MSETYTPPNPHPFKSFEWYQWTHEEAKVCHDYFMNWRRTKYQIYDALEIGCGMYGKYARYFNDGVTIYTGMDNDSVVIDECAKRHATTKAKWLCANVMDSQPVTEYDLVFSRSVIDHVPNINAFIEKCIELSNRYVYIMSYRGYFASIKTHKQEQGADGTYYNDISLMELFDFLKQLRVPHLLHCVPTGRPKDQIQHELHIEIAL